VSHLSVATAAIVLGLAGHLSAQCSGTLAATAQRFASPTNPATLTDLSGGPIVGGTWDLMITPGSITPVFEAYIIAFQPANVSMTVNLIDFTALVDPSFNITLGVLAGSGMQLQLPAVAAPVLCGLPLYVQGGITDAIIFEMTNAVDGIAGE